MSSENRDFREQHILHEGDTITVGRTVYTITKDMIAYGGSAVIYSAKSSDNAIKCVIKEVFPNEDSYARKKGIICPRDPEDGASAEALKWYREHIVEEQTLGGLCYNGTHLAVPIRYVIHPDKITVRGKEYTEDIQDGVFAVLDSMDGKAISFSEMLEHIRQPKSDDCPLKNGGCPTLHTTACLIEQVLLTLHSIHNQGVLFGDIHMDNIWLNYRPELGIIRTACFMDFGCSRRLVDGKKTDVIIGQRLFSSKGYRPPELSEKWLSQNDGTLSIQADIFSVGCLMLRCLFPKEYWDHFGISPVIGPRTIQRDDAKRLGIDDSLRKKTNEILEQAMNQDPKKRYSNADAMLEAIQKLKRDTEPPKYLLPSNLSAPDFFIPHSRDKELSVLTKAVRDGETVFLHGVGGIGKTECAIQLAKRLDPPRGAYLVHFQDSMRETILKMNFSGYKFQPKQKGLSVEALEEAEYQERLEMLREHYRDTVLIIDNFDADNKTLDELRREPAFQDFLGLDLKRIFTTRYPVGRKDWEIRELSETALLELMRYYCPDSSITDEQYLEILKEIQNHTLTAMLIAKTLEESWGEITPEMILEALRGSKLSQEEYPEVVSDQNRSYQQKQIYGHLKALYNLSGMSENDRIVLCCATLLPNCGIDVPLFKKSLRQDEQKSLTNLVKRGWLKRANNNTLTIHPVIREVCISELNPDEATCNGFLNQLWTIFETNRNSSTMWPVYDLFEGLIDPVWNWLTWERREILLSYPDEMWWYHCVTGNEIIKRICLEMVPNGNLMDWEALNYCNKEKKQTVYRLVSTWENLHCNEEWDVDTYISLAQYYNGGIFIPSHSIFYDNSIIWGKEVDECNEKALNYYKKAKELGARNLDEEIEHIEYVLSEEYKRALDEIVEVAREILQEKFGPK